MPGRIELMSAVERQLLAQLGGRLRNTRLERKVTAVDLARDLCISRSTLYAAEAGEPSTTIGTYVRILGALGLVSDLALVASPTPSRSKSIEIGRHVPQDLQSLLMHREAVRLIKENPELVARATNTLMRWRATGDSRTWPLWDEWKRILDERDWKLALQESERGNQLRQASPLATVLPQDVRMNIIRKVRALKEEARLAVA
jgi:transcriptional regulator with XRE-family HTH domain